MADKKRARRERHEESAAPTQTNDGDAHSIQEAVDISRLSDEVADAAPSDDAATAEDAVPTGTGDGEEKPAAGAEGRAGHKVSRRALVDRLFTKSEQIAKLTKQNRELEAKAGEEHDKWLRSVAEFENYRKRTRKEWDLLKQQSKAEVILEILNVVDDFERAFAVEDSGESNDFVAGFRLIYNNLIQVLERTGVHEFVALHEPFDPRFHMAVGQVEREGLAAGLVAEVVQKGYHLDGTVIRPAHVLVAK